MRGAQLDAATDFPHAGGEDALRLLVLAGNARGYWVVDPCKADGNGCETGDECCGGYCRPDPAGKLVCSAQQPTCAQEFEKCATDGDCCNSPSYRCINGRCSLPLTSARRIDLVVTELAVIAFPDGQATLVEVAPGVSVADVQARTEARLVVPETVSTMTL